MRVTVQRVKEASVEVDGKVRGSIQQGLLVFAGFDSPEYL
jgi:D-Tyr-tRNAtyr deacylase